MAGSSLVDYLVVDKKCLFHVKNFEVLDLNEFSDHCAIRYSFESNTYNSKNDDFCVNNVNINEKIVWDSEKVNDLRNLMRENENTFENIVSQASGGEISIDESITTFSNLCMIYQKKLLVKKTKNLVIIFEILNVHGSMKIVEVQDLSFSKERNSLKQVNLSMIKFHF